MAPVEIPTVGSAEVHVLHNGYVGLEGDDERAVYSGDRWVDRDAHGAMLSPSVRLLRTPGHTREDISTVASTAAGVYACTHAWWSADGPEKDPLAIDQDALTRSRRLLESFADVIIPGHGALFRPGTPA